MKNFLLRLSFILMILFDLFLEGMVLFNIKGSDQQYIVFPSLQDYVFFASSFWIKLQSHVPKVAEGNSSLLHLPSPCPLGHRKELLQTYFCY